MNSNEINNFLNCENVFNIEHEEARKKQIKKQEEENKKIKNLYNNFFDNKDGIKILNDLMNKSGYFYTLLNRASTDNGTIDALKMAYLDGRRSLFCEIANLLTTELLIKVKDYGTRTNNN